MYDTYYIVYLIDTCYGCFTDEKVQILCHKCLGNVFIGKLVNQTCSHFYFELEDTNELVIIPHRWIDFMAPKKEDKE